MSGDGGGCFDVKGLIIWYFCWVMSAEKGVYVVWFEV